jgi:hypothetical protein
MTQSPGGFRIHIGFQKGVSRIDDFFGPETVEAEQPIGLVQPVFP